MMNEDFWNFITATLIGWGFIGFMIWLAAVPSGVIKPDYKKICEDKGGVYLERTYQAGKSHSVAYTCVKKDTIIDMETK